MHRFLKAFINFVLYSNLWIAVAAVAMAAQSQLLLSGQVQPTPLLGFVFFATLLIYSLHRILVLKKVRPYQKKNRYCVISRYKPYLIVGSALSGIAAAAFFFLLPFQVQASAIPPSLIALGYVLPVLPGGRRLRDLSFFKNFLVAAAWSWITVVLPAQEMGMGKNIPMGLMALERACFIFALSLPFDIRDLEADRYNQVVTLPVGLGIKRTCWLAWLSLLVMAAFVFLNFHIDGYSRAASTALFASAALTAILVWGSGQLKHDYYYSGLIDGMMALQFLMVWMLA